MNFSLSFEVKAPTPWGKFFKKNHRNMVLFLFNYFTL